MNIPRTQRLRKVQEIVTTNRWETSERVKEEMLTTTPNGKGHSLTRK